MSRIAIIDDRRDLRETLKRSLDLELENSWESIDIDPMPELGMYHSWIIENDIAALIIDERLHEELTDSNKKVYYTGHDLVDFLRGYYPTLPLFVVTSYPEEEGLTERFKDVEEILERTDFIRNIENWVPRILRAAQRYIETYQSELEELSEKAEKIAKGEANENDIKRAKALRSKIGIAFPATSLQENIGTIKELEDKIGELELLQKDIQKHFDRKKHK